MKGLDAWITGSYGEDHPDNQQTQEAAEADRLHHARLEGEAAAQWATRRDAATTTHHCDCRRFGLDYGPSGPCSLCGGTGTFESY